MPTPRDVTQDIDPAPEPEESVRSIPKRPAPSRQADETPESLHKAENPAGRTEKPSAHTPSDAGDQHMGAREDQISETPAPAGSAFKDEPKQG